MPSYTGGIFPTASYKIRAMNVFPLAFSILTIAILLTYLNYRFIRVQTTIALMISALLLSLILIGLQSLGLANIAESTKHLLTTINFPDLLLHGMLSFFLFSGALTIDFDALKSQKWEIGFLASLSTLLSTLILGFLTYTLLPWIGLHPPLLYCLLFGALISPTDPIAVLATFKKLGAPKHIRACVAGESLFNDGVGIVLFTILYQCLFQHVPINATSISLLFLKQAAGGILYGLVLGWVTRYLLKPVHEPNLVILITLAVVTGGYSLALWLDLSGALAMVVSGIIIGQQQQKLCHHESHNPLAVFWEIIDDILNIVLFFLLGFELLVLKADGATFLAILIMIPLVLLVRLCTVAVPMKFIQRRKKQRSFIMILTWGGLRGGLAVALALSVPTSPYRDLILAMTYGVVAFSIIVQGLSIKPLLALQHKIEAP